MEASREEVLSAVTQALTRRRGASAVSTANVLREIRAAVHTALTDEQLLEMIVHAAPFHHVGVVFDHRDANG